MDWKEVERGADWIVVGFRYVEKREDFGATSLLIWNEQKCCCLLCEDRTKGDLHLPQNYCISLSLSFRQPK